MPRQLFDIPRQIVGGFYIARPLREFSVRVTRENGEKLTYTALARNSIGALESAIEMYGVCRISVRPKLFSIG